MFNSERFSWCSFLIESTPVQMFYWCSFLVESSPAQVYLLMLFFHRKYSTTCIYWFSFFIGSTPSHVYGANWIRDWHYLTTNVIFWKVRLFLQIIRYLLSPFKPNVLLVYPIKSYRGIEDIEMEHWAKMGYNQKLS